MAAHPFCAAGRRPQLFLDLLPDPLDRHLGLLDGSLRCVKSAGGGGGEHKVTMQIIAHNHTVGHKNKPMLKLCFQEATKVTGCVSAMTTPAIHFISVHFVWMFTVSVWRAL